MEKLKPCPFCGGMPVVVEDGYKAIAIHCFNCGADITAETERKAGIAWNRRAQPANEPLTLEQLRKMDGEPVYLAYHNAPELNGYQILKDIDAEPDEDGEMGARFTEDVWENTEYYGEDWIAYRRKPEPEGSEG